MLKLEKKILLFNINIFLIFTLDSVNNTDIKYSIKTYVSHINKLKYSMTCYVSFTNIK